MPIKIKYYRQLKDAPAAVLIYALHGFADILAAGNCRKEIILSELQEGLVAMDAGEIVGMMAFEKRKTGLFVNFAHVLRRYRGYGLYRRLHGVIMRRGAAEGITQIEHNVKRKNRAIVYALRKIGGGVWEKLADPGWVSCTFKMRNGNNE